METYLVIGLYTDDEMLERFADNYRAETAEEAEQMAITDHPGLTVAAVINSDFQVVA